MTAHCHHKFNLQTDDPDQSLVNAIIRALEYNHSRYGKYTPPAFITLNDADKLLFAISRLLDMDILNLGQPLQNQVLNSLLPVVPEKLRPTIKQVLDHVQTTQRHERG